jgi:hypothetical protein
MEDIEPMWWKEAEQWERRGRGVEEEDGKVPHLGGGSRRRARQHHHTTAG